MKYLLALLLASFIACSAPHACLGERCYVIKHAMTLEEQQAGFMADDKTVDGILFVFNEQQMRCIWMHNTSVPLHILWLDEDNALTAIERGTPYDETPLCYPGKQVLEIRSSLEPEVYVGDTVTFRT